MNSMCNKSQRPFLVLFSFLMLSFVFSFKNANAQPDAAKLFKQNCAVCHRLDKQKLTGPGLEGIASRVPQPADEWLHKWIKNNEKLRKSGDAYANKVYQDNAGIPMTPFEFLTDEEITALVSYIKNPPVAQPTTPIAPAGEVVSQPQGVDPLTVLLAVITFLIILISVLRGVKHSLKNAVNQKQNLPEEPELGLVKTARVWMSAHKRLIALMIIFLLAIGSKAAWDGMMGIGVYQGYKPEQPINFSHKIHAGDNAINCVYCHSSVEKSKTAGIPSVNVCMNCHKGIDKGPITGTVEIQKIYTAAGWNPETQSYDKPQQPIKWVRVHNLPDFAYFNHSQHVVVGKQECQTCHGEIQNMAVVEQFSPLTMVWCVDCHRKTEVKMEGNGYYEELHKTLALKYKGEKITVDKIGGIECSKCHY